MADRAGVRGIRIAGLDYDVKALAAIRVSNKMREPILGVDAYHGTALKPAVPGADVTITDSSGISIQTLQDVVGQEVQISLANGKIYTLVDATATDQIPLNPENGEIVIVFAASSCLQS